MVEREGAREKRRREKPRHPWPSSKVLTILCARVHAYTHTHTHRPGPAPRSLNMPGLMCCVLRKYAEWTARLHLVHTHQANNPRLPAYGEDSIGSCAHATSSRTCMHAGCHAVSCHLALGFYITHTHTQHRDPLLSPIQPSNSVLFFLLLAT